MGAGDERVGVIARNTLAHIRRALPKIVLAICKKEGENQIQGGTKKLIGASEKS